MDAADSLHRQQPQGVLPLNPSCLLATPAATGVEERISLPRCQSCSIIEDWSGGPPYPSPRTISRPGASCVKVDTLVTGPRGAGRTSSKSAVLSTPAVKVSNTRSLSGCNGQCVGLGGSDGGTPRGAVYGPSTPDRDQEREREHDAGCADTEDGARGQRNHLIHSNGVNNSGGGSGSTVAASCISTGTREAGVTTVLGIQDPQDPLQLRPGDSSAGHGNQDHVQPLHQRAPKEAATVATGAEEEDGEGAAAATRLTPPPAPSIAEEQPQSDQQQQQQQSPGVVATIGDGTGEPIPFSTMSSQVVVSSSLCRASSGTVSSVMLAARVASLDATMRNAVLRNAIQLHRAASASLLIRSTSISPSAAVAAEGGGAPCTLDGVDGKVKGGGNYELEKEEPTGVSDVAATSELTVAVAAAAAASPRDGAWSTESIGPVERHAAPCVPLSHAKASVSISRFEPQTPAVPAAEAEAGSIQLPLLPRLSRWDRHPGTGRTANLSSYLEGLDLEVSAALTPATEAAKAATHVAGAAATAVAEMVKGASGGGGGGDDLPLGGDKPIADAIGGAMPIEHPGTKPSPLHFQQQQQQHSLLPTRSASHQTTHWLRARGVYASPSSLGTAALMSGDPNSGWRVPVLSSRLPGFKSVSVVQDPKGERAALHSQCWGWWPNFHPLPPPPPPPPPPAPAVAYHPTCWPNADDPPPPVAAAMGCAHACTPNWSPQGPFVNRSCGGDGDGDGGGSAGGSHFEPSAVAEAAVAEAAVAEAAVRPYMTLPPPPPSPSRHNLAHHRQSENMSTSLAPWHCPPPPPPPPFPRLPQSQRQPLLQQRRGKTGRLGDSPYRLVQRGLPLAGASQYVTEPAHTDAGSPQATTAGGAATAAAKAADQHNGKCLTFAAITAAAPCGRVGDADGRSAGPESPVALRPGDSIFIREVQHDEEPTPRAAAVDANPFAGIIAGGFAAAAGGGGCSSYPTSLLGIADSDVIAAFAALGMGNKLPLPSDLHLASMTAPPPGQEQRGPFPSAELPGGLDVLVGAAAHGDACSLEHVLWELGYEALTALMQAVDMLEAAADSGGSNAPSSAGSPGKGSPPGLTPTTALRPGGPPAIPPPRAAAEDPRVAINRGEAGTSALRSRASAPSRVAAPHLCGQHSAAGDGGLAAAAAAAAQVAPDAMADTPADSGSLITRPHSAFPAAAAASGGSASGQAGSSAFALAARSTIAVAGNPERPTTRSRSAASEGGPSGVSNGSGRAGASDDDFHAPSSIVPLTLTTARTIRPGKIPHAAASVGCGRGGSEFAPVTSETDMGAVRGGAGGGGGGGGPAAKAIVAARGVVDMPAACQLLPSPQKSCIETRDLHQAVTSEYGSEARVGRSCSGRIGAVEAATDENNEGTVEVGVSDAAATSAPLHGIVVRSAQEVSRNFTSIPDAAAAATTTNAIAAEVSGSASAVLVPAGAAAAAGTKSAAVAAPPSVAQLRPMHLTLTSPFAQAALQAVALDDEVDDSDGTFRAADASEVRRPALDSVRSGAPPSSPSVTLVSSAVNAVGAAAAVTCTPTGGTPTVASPLLPPRPSDALSRSQSSATPQDAAAASAAAVRPGSTFRRAGSGRGPSRTVSNGACGVVDVGRRGSAGSAARERQYPAGPRSSNQHQCLPHKAERGGSGNYIDAPYTGSTPHPDLGSVPQFLTGALTFPAAAQMEVAGTYGAVPVAVPVVAKAVRQHSWQLPYQVAQAVLHGPPFPGPSPAQPYPHHHPLSHQWGGPLTHSLAPAAHSCDVPSYSAEPSGNGAPVRSSTASTGAGAGGVPGVWIVKHGSQDLPQQIMADSTQTFSPLMQPTNPQQLHQPPPWPAGAPLSSACPQPTLVRQASSAYPLPPAPLFVPLIMPQQQQQQPGGSCNGMGVMVCPPAPELAIEVVAAGVYSGAPPQYLQPLPAWAMAQHTVFPYGGSYQAVPYVVDGSYGGAGTTFGAGAFSVHGPPYADPTATPTGCLMRGPRDEVYDHPSLMVPTSPPTQQGDSRGGNPLVECLVSNWPGASSSFSSSYSGSGPSGDYSLPPGRDFDVWQHSYFDGAGTAIARQGSVVTMPHESELPAMSAPQPHAAARGDGSLVEQQLSHRQEHDSRRHRHRHRPASPQQSPPPDKTHVTPTSAPVVALRQASAMPPQLPGAVARVVTSVREDMVLAAPLQPPVIPTEVLYVDRRCSETNSGIAGGHQSETMAHDGAPYLPHIEGESLLPPHRSSPSSTGEQQQQQQLCNNAGSGERHWGRNRSRPRTKSPPSADGAGLPSRETLSTFKWCHVQHSRKQAPALDDDKVRELVRAQLQSRMPIRAPWYRDAATSRQQDHTATMAALQQRQEQQRGYRPAYDRGTAKMAPKARDYWRALGQEASPTSAAAQGDVGRSSGLGRVKSKRAPRTGVSSVGADVARGTGVFIPSKA